MTVIFSKKCEHGLQAVLLLSSKYEGKSVNAADIAEELKIPKEFVAKILQSLRKVGIVESKRGKEGGFALAKKPSEIKLIDIVKALDGEDMFKTCVLGFPGCSPENPCPVHYKWGKIRDDIHEMLEKDSLEDLKKLTLKKLSNI